jgi:hypothetical protein
MTFRQLSFMKALRIIFTGAIIISNIYLFYHDTNNSKTFPFPNNFGIIKIHVGQGEDLWILIK